MISDSDRDLVNQVQGLLDDGLSVNQAAEHMGFANTNTLYQKLYRLGYRIENRRRLVPIHAEPLDSTQEAVT